MEKEKKFFTETLGFGLHKDKETTFSVHIGWTELIFTESETAHHYHYCFLVPSNKLTEAMAWMEKRVDVIEISTGRKIHRFQDWNSESFYFLDASGNLAEFIVRYDLDNQIDHNFSIADVLCVNEIGMPTMNVEECNAKLSDILGTAFWKGDLGRFGTHGTQEGLFLLPNYEQKHVWFPTSIRIKPEPFEIEVEVDGKKTYLRFVNLNKFAIIRS